jgi:hypothetical protein
MEDEKRVTMRLSGPLYRVLAREAEKQDISLSEHMRRLLLASRPHLLVLEDIGRIQKAGQPYDAPREYLTFLSNMARRLEEGLKALESFEAMSAQWRQEAQRELTAALADVQERMAQGEWMIHLGDVFSKLPQNNPGQGEGQP